METVARKLIGRNLSVVKRQRLVVECYDDFDGMEGFIATLIFEEDISDGMIREITRGILLRVVVGPPGVFCSACESLHAIMNAIMMASNVVGAKCRFVFSDEGSVDDLVGGRNFIAYFA